MKNKVAYIIFGIIVFLVVTNPNLKEARKYMDGIYGDAYVIKNANLFVCTLYTVKYETYEGSETKHITQKQMGIAGNFLPL